MRFRAAHGCCEGILVAWKWWVNTSGNTSPMEISYLEVFQGEYLAYVLLTNDESTYTVFYLTSCRRVLGLVLIFKPKMISRRVTANGFVGRINSGVKAYGLPMLTDFLSLFKALWKLSSGWWVFECVQYLWWPCLYYLCLRRNYFINSFSNLFVKNHCIMYHKVS